MKKKNISKLLAFFFLILLIIFSTNEDLYNKLKTSINDILNINNIDNLVENVNLDSVDLEVYFLDVGQADSILVKSQNEYMLIDAGNNNDGEKLVSFLNSLGISKFNYAIGTHAHEDHIGGMDNIINNFPIENFYMPEVLTTTKTFEDVLDALERNNMFFDTPKEGEILSLGDSKIEVIHVGDDTSDLNDSSIVLRLVYKGISVLFTGDATSNIEEAILNKNIESDVLKVAHHGSKYSTTNDFLNRVHPKYAVISVGKDNSYNHPADSTIKKLSNLQVKIHRTDEEGTILMQSDGVNISFTSIKTNTNG